jgi:hypothetical protein
MLLSCTGILGLISFLWLFVTCIWAAVKNSMPWKYGLAAWPVVFLVYGLAGSNIYSSWYQALFAFFAVLNLTSGSENIQVQKSSFFSLSRLARIFTGKKIMAESGD